MLAENDLADLRNPSRYGGSNNPLDCLNRLGGQTRFEDKPDHKTVSPGVTPGMRSVSGPRNLIEEFDPGSA